MAQDRERVRFKWRIRRAEREQAALRREAEREEARRRELEVPITTMLNTAATTAATLTVTTDATGDGRYYTTTGTNPYGPHWTTAATNTTNTPFIYVGGDVNGFRVVPAVPTIRGPMPITAIELQRGQWVVFPDRCDESCRVVEMDGLRLTWQHDRTIAVVVQFRDGQSELFEVAPQHRCWLVPDNMVTLQLDDEIEVQAEAG